MIEVEMVGISSGFCCINPLKRGWWNKVGVGKMEEGLIIYFVVNRLKWDVLKTDENQVNELAKDGGVWCRVKNKCERSWCGDR